MKKPKFNTPSEKYFYYRGIPTEQPSVATNAPAVATTASVSAKNASELEVLAESIVLQMGGPGEVCRIASRLVSVKSPEGKRVFRITVVMDQWAPFISGSYIGEGDHEQEDISMALLSIIEDKGEFCRRYGIAYNPDNWPAMPLPRTIICDSDENLAHITEAFQIKRVRDSFCNVYAASLLEKALDDFAKAVRRAPYQGSSKVLALEVMKWNQMSIDRKFWTPSHDGCRPFIDLVREGLARIRKTRTGHSLTCYSFDEQLKLHPFVKVLRVLPEGIFALARGAWLKFSPMVLGSDQRWLKRGHLTAHYDPGCVDRLWVLDPLTQAMVPCRLLDEGYAGLSWDRVASLKAHQKRCKAAPNHIQKAYKGFIERCM